MLGTIYSRKFNILMSYLKFQATDVYNKQNDMPHLLFKLKLLFENS